MNRALHVQGSKERRHWHSMDHHPPTAPSGRLISRDKARLLSTAPPPCNHTTSGGDQIWNIFMTEIYRGKTSIAVKVAPHRGGVQYDHSQLR